MAVNWENKEEAIKELQNMYPHMKIFQINMIVDLYKQSLKDEDLAKMIDDKIDEKIELPSIKDFPEIDYGTKGAMSIIKKGDYEEWQCRLCGMQNEYEKSIEDNTICKGCWDINYKENDEISDRDVEIEEIK
jgi:hypothetical protein